MGQEAADPADPAADRGAEDPAAEEEEEEEEEEEVVVVVVDLEGLDMVAQVHSAQNNRSMSAGTSCPAGARSGRSVGGCIHKAQRRRVPPTRKPGAR